MPFVCVRYSLVRRVVHSLPPFFSIFFSFSFSALYQAAGHALHLHRAGAAAARQGPDARRARVPGEGEGEPVRRLRASCGGAISAAAVPARRERGGGPRQGGDVDPARQVGPGEQRQGEQGGTRPCALVYIALFLPYFRYYLPPHAHLCRAFPPTSLACLPPPLSCSLARVQVEAFFQAAINGQPKWEEPHFAMARFYDRHLTQLMQLGGEAQKKAASASGASSAVPGVGGTGGAAQKTAPPPSAAQLKLLKKVLEDYILAMMYGNRVRSSASVLACPAFV